MSENNRQLLLILLFGVGIVFHLAKNGYMVVISGGGVSAYGQSRDEEVNMRQCNLSKPSTHRHLKRLTVFYHSAPRRPESSAPTDTFERAENIAQRNKDSFNYSSHHHEGCTDLHFLGLYRYSQASI